MARLIDDGLLEYETSMAGQTERYTGGRTSHTIHVWWARRPHSSMRALVFAALCRENSEGSQALMGELGAGVQAPAGALGQARELLAGQYDKPPRVLDMFGGGGTIGYEAINLGADASSVDVNELAVFVQRANLVYSQEVDAEEGARLLRSSGDRVLDRLEEETEHLFGLRHQRLAEYPEYRPSIYLWTYSTACPECGYRYYLSRRPWVSKKKKSSKSAKNRLAAVVTAGERGDKCELREVDGDFKARSVWKGRTGQVICPKCSVLCDDVSLDRCREKLVAVGLVGPRRSKEFVDPEEINFQLDLAELAKEEGRLLRELGVEIPTTKLPKWSGVVNPALYGIESHADFFSPRQRVVLLHLIRILREEYGDILRAHGEAKARYVLSALSALVDQLVDWNSRLSMWISQNEQVGRGFCGPGISMIWDFAEIDPVSESPGNLRAKLERIIDGMAWIGEMPGRAEVLRAPAQDLPFADESFDAVVTDPPYYDNIYYSILSDFFFSWKRLVLQVFNDEIREIESTNAVDELVASTQRSGGPQKAHDDYCRQFGRAISEAARVLKPDGVFGLVYSHSAILGWDAVLKAYRQANLQISTVSGMSIERRQRPRAMTSKAVNTCVVIVARKASESGDKLHIDEILAGLKERIEEDGERRLTDFGWEEEDVGRTFFARGVGMLANCRRVLGVDGDLEAMTAVEEVVRRYFPAFRLQRRRSL